MILCLDSSIYIKNYILESGREDILAFVKSTFYCSQSARKCCRY